MFPDIDLLPNKEDTSLMGNPLGEVFLFDFSNKEHVLKDGKPVEATYEQAIKQWVTMLLITELDEYEVYKGTAFGLGIKSFLGRRDIPIAVINSEVKRQIEERVAIHPEIIGVDNFVMTREGSKASLSFSVQTLKGIVDGVESEVSINGGDI